jgi:uncharacterized protein YndB with AHSA1/START domain
MDKFIVKKSIAIKAPVEKVWDALTNPEKTREYFFNCKVYSDWKKGSAIVFKGKVFWIIPIEMKGTITQIEPGRLLQYTLSNKSDGSKTTSTVTDKLTYTNGITTLNITDDVGQGEGAEKRYKRSVKGWDKILNGLKEFIEDK